MGCDDICRHIVGRFLKRCKGVDILSYREHDYTAGMLSRRTSDTFTAFCDTCYLAVAADDIMLFKIMLNQSVCCLVRKTRYCTGSECLACAKDYFRIFMSLGLVLTGEVKVDIRLLVSLKPEECLKGYIKAVFLKWLAASGAYLVRHIASCHTCILLYII